MVLISEPLPHPSPAPPRGNAARSAGKVTAGGSNLLQLR
jgi:hypothetical protein